MSILTWFTGASSKRSKALAIFRHGVKRAKLRDIDGAITNYTRVMNLEDVPSDVKAMAQFNRALAYSSARKYDKATDDLDGVLAMPNIPPKVKNAAKVKRERMRKRSP